MNSHHENNQRLHPSFRALTEFFPGRQITLEDVQLRRQMNQTMIAQFIKELPQTVSYRSVTCPAEPSWNSSKPIRLAIFEPNPSTDESLPVYLHFHGGGFLFGNPEGSSQMLSSISQKLKLKVISVDYSKAPEHKFPIQLLEAYHVLQWIFQSKELLKVDVDKLIVGGESAGGGLAASLTHYNRDHGQYPILCQHLIYPMLDINTGIDSVSKSLGEILWTGERNQFAWRHYLRESWADEPLAQYVNLAHAKRYDGLPPLMLLCGDMDLFLPENLAYISALAQANTPCECHIYPGTPHGFVRMGDSPITQTCIQDTIRSFSSALESI